MKKNKLASVFLYVFFCFGIAAVLLTNFHYQTIINTETQHLLGAIGQNDPDLAAESFRTYIESNLTEKEELSIIGAKILSASGYAYSGNYYLSKNIFMKSWHIYAAIVAILVCLFILAQTTLRKYATEQQHAKAKENRLEQQVYQLEREKEQQFADISCFEENLYHQLKTPLTSLQLCFDQLSIKHHDVPDDSQLLFTIKMQLQKLSNLVTLFLRDRKLSSNIIKFQYRLESLNQIVEAAVEQCREIATFYGVYIKTNIAKEDFFLYCDNVWLTECVSTLIENAIEHSTKRKVMEVRLQKEDYNYRIQVISYGTVLSENDINNIFTRYYTGNSAHFGIGLHMAKNIAKNHHGSIQVYNKENDDTGVEFDVVLPIIDI